MIQTLEKIKKNVHLKNKMALKNYRSVQTIERWMKTNSVNLRTEMNLKLMAEELEISPEEVLLDLQGQKNSNHTPSV
ncbi:MAG: hypothetical protein ABFD02_08165 [Bacteroidales bacterium]